ncbi:hypothetical protein AX769_08325 [Frondihabitans sp. PAMC 28766]|uniref:choice-of-anchor G family protein n=1 Tax=Frondihabitans sp. PAMC 28766 TaxID=1795630 RepID=UPI00078DF2C2|nr:choice-of-anchor G family protein [Frondihabitans sp. PAMC 28766]AMM20172.1 hypothetical protein AX769_08325 [Frondihabitans sp. PAMC 28766]
MRAPIAHSGILRGGIAATAVFALGLGLGLMPVMSASATPTDQSEGQARVLGSTLLDTQLAEEGEAVSGNPSAPGPSNASIDVQALDGLANVNLTGTSIPLIDNGTNGGLLDLGTGAGAGLLKSYSSSDTATHAVSASGAIDGNGGLDTGATGDPSNIGATKANLTPLLGQLGLGNITNGVVDQVSLELGAIASRAEQTAAGAAVRTYSVGDGDIVIHSPAVATLGAHLTSTITGVQTSLNAAVTPTGSIGKVVAASNISANVGVGQFTAGPGTAALNLDLSGVASSILAKPLTSTDGIATVDLSTGTISIDIAKLMKGPAGADLNGLDPNTQVLTAATINKVVAAVGNALGGVSASATTALSAAVNAATLTVTLPGTLTVGVAPAVTTSHPIVTVTGTLAGFAGATGSTAPAVAVTGNVQGIPLATFATALATPIQNAVTAPLKPVTSALLTSTASGFSTAITNLVTPVVNSLNPALTGVLGNIVQIVINAQSEGDLGSTSATVRALAITVLPNVPASVATVDLASSTVRVAAAVTPPPVCGTNAPIVVNGAGQQLQQYTASGTLVSSGTTTDVLGDIGYAGGNLYGVPFNSAGTLQELNAATGATEATIPITGPLATKGGRNALSGMPNGDLLVGVAGSAVLYELNPTTGVSTVFSLSLPSGTTSGGDFFQLSDGDLLAAVLAPTTYELVRIHPDNSSTVIGTTPAVYGGTISGGKLYLAGGAGAGPIYQLDTIPSAPSTDALPLTTLASTGYSIYGAASTQDAASCPTPSVTTGPDPVAPGETLTTNSQGWPADTDVTVVYKDANGNPIGAPKTVHTDANGTFTDTLVVPKGTPAGDLTITGTDAAGDTASTTGTVAAVTDPTLTTGPAKVKPGATVTTTSDGWPPNSDVTLTYTDANGKAIGDPKTVHTDADGSFTDTLTVPNGTPLGTLTATGSNANSTASDSVTVVPDPAITTTPTPVAPGGTLTSTSTGWPPNTDVTIVYKDADGNPIGDPKTVHTDANGGFTDTLVVPAGTPAGDLTITGTDAAGDTATATATVVIPASPTLTAGPADVKPGGTVTIDSAGWPPNSDVTVVYKDANGAPIGDPKTVHTDADGKFTDTLTVPAGTVPGALSATGTNSAGATATDSVTVVPDPAITATPTPVKPGGTLTATSTGWPADTDVTVVYKDAAGNPVGDPHTVHTDADGAFTDTLAVPQGTPAGDLTITGMDAAGDTATTTATVAAPDVPTLAAGPASVKPGDTVTVNSGGWPPNSDVTVVYKDANGAPIGDPKTVRTDGDGKFTDTLTVPDGTVPGALTATGTDDAGATASDSVTVSPTPAITSGPTPVAPGGTLTTDGTGFPPDTDITVIYKDVNGDPIGDPHVIHTDSNGDFTDTLVVPKGTPAGDAGITATDPAGDSATGTAPVAAPDAPTLTIGPDSVKPGGTATVDSAGWPPNTDVTVVYKDAAGKPIGTSHVVHTDADGKFTDTLKVPAGTVPGALTATGTDTAGATASDATTVTPTPSITPASKDVPPGGKLPISSDGWPPNTDITVVYRDADGKAIGDPHVIHTDADGKFTDTLDVPKGTPAGDLTITGTDPAGDTTSAVAAVEKPTITVDPDPIAPGGTGTIHGDGFPPDTDITIVVIDDSGDPIGKPTIIKTDGDGSFTETITIPKGTPAGPITITGDDGAGDSTSTPAGIAIPVAPGGGTGTGGTGSTSANVAGGVLAFTGSNPGAAGGIAALLLGLGTALTMVARRRKRRHE